ncbi:hypothetical protein O0I10_010823 [Lichtheimia ornata]|uniref:Uncharacterized protein n=1 Tax=Lichtheimia ornata TaxID=688661 RepID=A0AAD7XT57_9FUNG|nr:uncharacterized protein O0I10_010823 [Lichtheimia ornata]KAJ8653495.1 hypothetical protein O0I10_010823 [Lichtheimia ornata]
MGKSKTKFTSNPNNVSRHANSSMSVDAVDASSNSKQRIEQELDLLHARKQTIDLSAASSGKVKKKNAKKGVNVRQQKKLAKALAIADKEEFKVEKAVTKAEKRKARKMVWT